MSIAIYHFEAKVITRTTGRTAVGAAAYMSCSEMTSQYDGIHHNYTRKQGLVFERVFLPENASAEWTDREKLWNAVEAAETAKDSRLARQIILALPIELDHDQQIKLLTDFVQKFFISDGMCADVAIHDAYTNDTSMVDDSKGASHTFRKILMHRIRSHCGLVLLHITTILLSS